MQWLHDKSYLQHQLGYKDLDIHFFPAAAIFKSQLLKMAANVMTGEFGTIHHYSILKENCEAGLCSSLDRYEKIAEHNVNYDILIHNNHVLNSDMRVN